MNVFRLAPGVSSFIKASILEYVVPVPEKGPPVNLNCRFAEFPKVEPVRVAKEVLSFVSTVGLIS